MALAAQHPAPIPFPQTTPDDQLVAQTLAGDKAAFATLVERYKQPVYTLAKRLLRHPTDAEDAAQGAPIRAYVRLSSYRTGSNFRAWLLSITAHWCIDQLRRHQTVALESHPAAHRGGRQPGDTSPARRAPPRGAPATRHPAGPLSRVIELRYWRGLSYAEVSDTLAEPTSTVRMRLFRAHRLLRAALAQSESQGT